MDGKNAFTEAYGIQHERVVLRAGEPKFGSDLPLFFETGNPLARTGQQKDTFPALQFKFARMTIRLQRKKVGAGESPGHADMRGLTLYVDDIQKFESVSDAVRIFRLSVRFHDHGTRCGDFRKIRITL